MCSSDLARINLTVIRNSGDAGTVSLEVSTSDYRLKADLSITMYSSAPEAGAGRATGRIDGRISTDSASELRAIETPLSAFITAMKDEGYDTAGIASGADMIPENRYLGRIGELSRRAQGDTQDMLRRSRREVSTDRLYRVAKSFLSFFL